MAFNVAQVWRLTRPQFVSRHVLDRADVRTRAGINERALAGLDAELLPQKGDLVERILEISSPPRWQVRAVNRKQRGINDGHAPRGNDAPDS